MDWIQARGGLEESYQTLRTRACKIVYLGASVAMQKEGYCARLHNALVQETGQLHTMINASLGGVGSITAVFTMEKLALQHAPDFCFVEYATGDMGDKTPPEEVAPAVEGMVRKLQRAGCATVFLYLYRRDKVFDGTNAVVNDYERVAEGYGVPSLNVGRVFEEKVASGEFDAGELLRDMVHTTPRGSEVTSELIMEGLATIWGGTATAPSFLERGGVEELFGKGFERAKMVPIERTQLLKPEEGKQGRFRFFYDYLEIDSGNEIRCKFAGDLVGLFCVVGKESGVVEVETPNETREVSVWDVDCYYERLTAVILYPFVLPNTAVRIRLTEKAVEYGELVQRIEQSEMMRKNLKVIAFMVRGEG